MQRQPTERGGGVRMCLWMKICPENKLKVLDMWTRALRQNVYCHGKMTPDERRIDNILHWSSMINITSISYGNAGWIVMWVVEL